MWPSTSPPTLRYEIGLTAGVPVAFSSASGKTAQPSVGAKRTLCDFFRSDFGAIVKLTPFPLSTTKSAAGLGASAGVRLPSAWAARKVWSAREGRELAAG